MPFIRVTTNEKITKEGASTLTARLGADIECIKGKSEAWLMLEFKGEATMAFRGSDAACAMVEVDLLGAASREDKEALTSCVCQTVTLALGVPTDRIYVRYLETDTWGYDCENF
jgi:phenylpyruvate tautomerase PptA (4-oxalocrotonate tautomerase family)